MPRKVFDDASGKHVDKQHTLPIEQIFEPAPHVVRALEIKCPICNAQPGEKCGSIIDSRKYFDVPHAGRIAASNKEGNK
jgi:hypothetical protein